MLTHQPFSFDIIKKLVVLFGSTFNNIYIERKDVQGGVSQIIKIPLSYSNKDKLLAKVDSDPESNRPYSAIVPRIGFSLIGMRYDSRIKTPTLNYIGHQITDHIDKQYVGVPYLFDFELYILSKNLSDSNRIIEQILPFFTPDFTNTVELIPEMGITLDIPITFQGMSFADKYDGLFQDRRTIIHTLKFNVRCPVYGPIYHPGIIKYVQSTFYIPKVPDGELRSAVGVTPPLERLVVQVTLTANGDPTENIAESIPYNEINIDDHWGIGQMIMEFSGPTIIGDLTADSIGYSMNFYYPHNSGYYVLVS